MFSFSSFAPNKGICSKHWLISACLVFLTVFFFLTSSGSTKLRQTVQTAKDTFSTQSDSCSVALASQVDLLKSEYSKLLNGVTHVAMIGFPFHGNKGDSAIWSGEVMILEALGIEIVHICIDMNVCDNPLIRTTLEEYGGPTKTAILFHGGGNFGDIWHNEQENRERVVVDFHDYRIRSFPQTYKFYQEANLVQAQKIYGDHPDLQLTARDTKSFMALERDFGKKHKLSLLPDAATMLHTSPLLATAPKQSDLDFLFLARTDGEGSQNHWNDQTMIEELLYVTNENGTLDAANMTIRDWIDEEPVGILEKSLNEQAQMRVDWCYDFLGQGALIIADRLHAHILSTVWGIDHITVEEGSYAKLSTYHDTWLRDCGQRVRTTTSVREAVDAAKDWYKRGKSFS
ncbi:hypothetical protein LTR10_014576 [Elasticomyces elasticus]|nr:hypothetical protein LTR10_014576 [Elasticomyces elasticus]KAK5043021.1 hypothetical protein LTR13_000792 [Exophiala sideris]KAK5186529.1 hypothetical protein LTR44_001585 [Eurotiomycetes sp. CCFEE 6388]